MASPHSSLWLEVEPVGDVTVLRFTVPRIWKESTIEAMDAHLNEILEEGRQRLVLHFGQVESMNSLLLGKLNAWHKRVRDTGGRLAVCGLNPAMGEVVEQFRLDEVLPIYSDEQAALQSF